LKSYLDGGAQKTDSGRNSSNLPNNFIAGFIKRNVGLIFVGLVSAIALHGAYNFLIVRNDGAIFLILTGILLGGATALVIHLFNRLKHYTAYQQASIDEVVENKK